MKLQGCYTAIVTPFCSDGSIDEEGLRSNIEFLINAGVAGVVPCGTTGESATMSWDEHNRVVSIVLDQVHGRVQVIAGAGSNNTAEAIESARHARACGADAILCITPYYNKPTQEGLFEHYRAIVTRVDIPMIVYNVPGRTGVNILPETIERLCAFDAIIGVKEASGDLVQVSSIHRRCGDRLAILSGDDALTLPLLACGGSGVISVTANVWPEKMNGLVTAWHEGDAARALQLHEELLPLSNAMFFETNPIPVKTAMNHFGLAAGVLRLPLVPMTGENKARMMAVIGNERLS